VILRWLGLLFCLLPLPAAAQDVAGDFDFYVLSLSWSPSYCEAEGSDADGMQCRSGRPFGFVVHGLWPQYENGFPEYCDTWEDGPDAALTESLLDLIPSRGLIGYQWRKHGACAGLSAEDYFDEARLARERIRVPPALEHIERYTTVAPEAVETAFMVANPGLEAGGIAVTCDERRLREVRICLTTDLEFRPCPEVDARTCRRERVVLPPSR
jgi:ribonuclease T2